METREFNFHQGGDPAAGKVLISAANMTDPNFRKSVILLCEHNEQGSFGLILNKKLSALQLNDAISSLVNWDTPLYQGGPVQLNTLHFLHNSKEIKGAKEIMPGVFWGGDFDTINNKIHANQLSPHSFRFFIGYSGWGAGQLEQELENNSWYCTEATTELIFPDPSQDLWKSSLLSLGKEFEILVNFPEDPSLN